MTKMCQTITKWCFKLGYLPLDFRELDTIEFEKTLKFKIFSNDLKTVAKAPTCMCIYTIINVITIFYPTWSSKFTVTISYCWLCDIAVLVVSHHQ